MKKFFNNQIENIKEISLLVFVEFHSFLKISFG